MNSSELIYITSHLIAAVIMVALAVVIWGRVRPNDGKMFAYTMSLLALFSVMTLLNILVEDVQVFTLFNIIASIVLVVAIQTWSQFVLMYCEIEQRVRRVVIWGMTIITLCFILSVLTNHFHQLVYQIEIREGKLIYEYGIVVYIYAAYSCLVVLNGLAVLGIKCLFDEAFSHKLFFFFTLQAFLFAIDMAIFFIPEERWYPIYDFHPLLWSIGGILCWFSVRFQLLNIKELPIHMFLQEAEIGTIVCDERGRVIEVNSATRQIFNRQSTAMIGQKLSDLFSVFTDYTPNMKVQSQHDSLIEVKGDPMWVRIESFPVMSEKTRQGNMFTLRDVTTIKESEQLSKSMSTMIMHDLKQPIASIQLLLQLAQREKTPAEKKADLLKSAEEQVKRLNDMVGNLHIINQAKNNQLTLNRRAHSIETLIEMSVKTHRPPAESKEIVLIRSIPKNMPVIELDAHLITRVLDNMISNALRFTPDGGQVSIYVDDSAPEQIMISICDDGIGLQTDTPEDLFNEGVSMGTKEAKKSSGLGLAFCRLVVEAHNGRIWFDQPDVGTRINFTLPKQCVE